jgi:uncharacterized protein
MNMEQKNKIPKLEEFELNEDFYNPFDDDEITSTKEPKHISDKFGSLALKKDVYSPSKIFWTKTDNGDYTVKSNSRFYKGDIIAICPIIMLEDSVKAIKTLNDKVFEIDKNSNMYGVVLGYGTLYRHSQNPNVDFAYNKSTRQMHFIAKRNLEKNEELTINYGKDYWAERMNFNNTPEVEESQVQPNNLDMQRDKEIKTLSDPMNPNNPVRSGVAIKGMGQSYTCIKNLYMKLYLIS